jgi:hypothetical protein
LDLLGYQGKGGEKFHHYFDNDFCQGAREGDVGINAKTVQKVLNRLKQVDQRVIAGLDVLDSLIHSDVTRIRAKEIKTHTPSKMERPANNALAGGNGCGMGLINVEYH